MSMFENLHKEFTPIHKLGWRFIAIAAAICIFLWWLGAGALSLVALFVTIYLALIFRNAPRMVPTGEKSIVSPCDAYVTAIEQALPPPELGLGVEPRTCITLAGGKFSSLIMRAPFAGRIENMSITVGHGFASLLGSQEGEREKLFMTIARSDGEKLGMLITSGWLPNQVFKLVQDDETLFLGQHIAFTSPFSTVKLYLPVQAQVMVGVRSRVIAGETLLIQSEGAHPRQFIKV